jgi:predicted alpha/beta hydrolase family esterase
MAGNPVDRLMSAMSEPRILLLPGLHNSGPNHWQSCWEDELPNCRRVEQRDWHAPRLGDWLETLMRSVEATPGPFIVAAHSLGCALVAHFAHVARGRLPLAALLVAPADVDKLAPQSARIEGFAPMPLAPLPFPTLVVTSNNDPYVDVRRARAFARAWDAAFVDIGPCGHINAESGHGRWDEGRVLLGELIARSMPLRPVPAARAQLPTLS